MNDTDIQQARRLRDGFRGRFFYDAERDDIGYIRKECDDKRCDCEQKLNADGDQDCSISVASSTWDDHVAEGIVAMLNAFPALLDEVERLRSDEATMKLSRMLGLGDPVRPDIHAKVCRQRDELNRQLAAADAALASAHSERDGLRAERDAAWEALLRGPITTQEIRDALAKGRVDRKCAEGDHAWRSLVTRNETLTKQLAAVTAARDELASLARDMTAPEHIDIHDRIASLRKAGTP